MRFLLRIVIFIHFGFIGYSNNPDFEEVYSRVATQLTAENPQLALHLADSLYTTSTDPIDKIRTLMLSANIYLELNDLRNASDCAIRAQSIANKKASIDWQVRIQGFLSAIYANLGLTKEASLYLNQTNNLISKVKSVKTRNLYYLLLYQSKAYVAFRDQQYDLGIQLLDSADFYMEELGGCESLLALCVITLEMRGRLLLHLESYDKAKYYYQEAEKNLEKAEMNDPELLGFIYTGLGKTWFEEGKNKDMVEGYYDKALEFVTYTSNKNLELLLYGFLVEYYKYNDDLVNYKLFNEKLKLIESQIEESRLRMVKEMVHELTSENDVYKRKNNKYKIYGGISFSLTAILMVGYVVKKKRDKRKFVETIRQLEARLETRTDINRVESKDQSRKYTVEISETTESKILKKLNEFEEKKQYLQPGVTLTFLANYCETNTKYVSKILKKTKDKDFNTYINELKVYYIAEILKEDEACRKYKISYLADMAGFSSHSKFSMEFKNIIGLSPSLFIDLLNEH